MTERSAHSLDIDGGDFEDIMVKHGIFVKVPADKAFKVEFDCGWMYRLAWKLP